MPANLGTGNRLMESWMHGVKVWSWGLALGIKRQPVDKRKSHLECAAGELLRHIRPQFDMRRPSEASDVAEPPPTGEKMATTGWSEASS